eukprot:1720522-Amphidinium_carterae.1
MDFGPGGADVALVVAARIFERHVTSSVACILPFADPIAGMVQAAVTNGRKYESVLIWEQDLLCQA